MSKKLGMSIAVLLLSTLLLWAGLLDADNWVGLAQVNLMAYAGGNVGEHWTNKGQPVR